MSTDKLINPSVLNALIAPVISEKSTALSESGNVVCYYISQDATKDDVKKAIEFFFKVQVESVRVLTCKGKVKRFGGSIGRRKNKRKAYISLKDGQENIFEQEVK